MEETLQKNIEEWVQSRLYFDKFKLYPGRIWTEEVAGGYFLCCVLEEQSPNRWEYKVVSTSRKGTHRVTNESEIHYYIRKFYVGEGDLR